MLREACRAHKLGGTELTLPKLPNKGMCVPNMSVRIVFSLEGSLTVRAGVVFDVGVYRVEVFLKEFVLKETAGAEGAGERGTPFSGMGRESVITESRFGEQDPSAGFAYKLLRHMCSEMLIEIGFCFEGFRAGGTKECPM
uniref:Uncharacterized protein n=1 Tax=Lepeophtheirus salmonis TaxID=72036 RepID=A0A0K2U5R0_LEPSM